MAEVKKTAPKDKKPNPHEGHRKRAWQELSRIGFDEDTPPHKVLELILFFTIPRKDTNILAHDVLKHFDNSFANVLEASVEQLMEVPGIGEYTAVHIKSILEIARFYQSQKARQEKQIFDRYSASEFLFNKLSDAQIETAYLLCLDNVYRYLACPKISEGDESTVPISPRKLIEKITKIGATNVILAHNHPRGVALPSDADLKLTTNISVALSSINVVFMDHIIVAEHDYVSLYDSAKYSYLFKL